MEQTINQILRNLNITRAMTLTILLLVIATAVLVFYKPSPKDSAVEAKNEALEQRRQADIMVVKAKLDSISIDNKLSDAIANKKVADFTRAIDENTKTFKQIRNEKPRDYSSYNSIQLQRKVSELVRQYTAEQ